ncbi:hypothetical protein [Burkholderia gladioli]|uniref:hypothetical protein n=1 Tax=Burkholderia gladioli TaxID=28095 RepID=UPI002FE1C0F0
MKIVHKGSPPVAPVPLSTEQQLSAIANGFAALRAQGVALPADTLTWLASQQAASVTPAK